MWSQRTRYAVRTLMYLATHNHHRTPARELARENEVPAKYLETILADLRAAGLVRSTKGAGGGYEMVSDPSTVRLLDVVRVVDPDLVAESATDGAAEEPVLDGIARHVVQELARTTVADAVMRWQQTQSTLTYVI